MRFEYYKIIILMMIFSSIVVMNGCMKITKNTSSEMSIIHQLSGTIKSVDQILDKAYYALSNFDTKAALTVLKDAKKRAGTNQDYLFEIYYLEGWANLISGNVEAAKAKFNQSYLAKDGSKIGIALCELLDSNESNRALVLDILEKGRFLSDEKANYYSPIIGLNMSLPAVKALLAYYYYINKNTDAAKNIISQLDSKDETARQIVDAIYAMNGGSL